MEENSKAFAYEFKLLHFCLLKTISKGLGLSNALVVLENILNNIFEVALLQLIQNQTENIKILEIEFLQLVCGNKLPKLYLNH